MLKITLVVCNIAIASCLFYNCFWMFSFLFKRSDSIVTKTIFVRNKVNSALFQRTGNPLLFSKSFSSHSQEQLYIPFAIDSAREHASIKFWVSKNTNLREVNVNIRVLCKIMIL